MSNVVIHIVRHRVTPTMMSEMLQAMTILDPAIRARVEVITRRLLEGVMSE